MPAGGHGAELSSYHGNDWLFVLLRCGRFKKYKQAGSHSNSFRLTNGRADDTGRNKRVYLCLSVTLSGNVCLLK